MCTVTWSQPESWVGSLCLRLVLETCHLRAPFWAPTPLKGSGESQLHTTASGTSENTLWGIAEVVAGIAASNLHSLSQAGS